MWVGGGFEFAVVGIQIVGHRRDVALARCIEQQQDRPSSSTKRRQAGSSTIGSLHLLCVSSCGANGGICVMWKYEAIRGHGELEGAIIQKEMLPLRSIGLLVVIFAFLTSGKGTMWVESLSWGHLQH